MVLAAYLTTALVVGAVGAWHLLRDQHLAGPRMMFSMAMWMAALVAPIQILAGDQHGLNTLEHQPAKIGAWKATSRAIPDGAPLILFGCPTRRPARSNYAIEIPRLGSLILTHALDAPMAGPRHRAARRLAAGADRVLVVPHHGRHRLADARARAVQPVVRAGAARCSSRGCCIACAGRWALPASSRCSPAGSPPRSGASPSRSTACCAPPIARRPSPRPPSAPRCVAFVVVYFVVFGAGIIYILRLMAQPPHPGEAGPSRATCRRAPPASRRAACRREAAAMSAAIDLATRLGRHHRLRRVRLCGDGRLRSRHRHPLSAVPGEGRPRRHDEHRRAGLGRQRDLAGARRRRPDGGLPARLCRADAGALHARSSPCCSA